MWGIVPAAGRGSRIQPLAFSKELLPVGSRNEGGTERPIAVSEYIVERMLKAGVTKLCFVISAGKSDIVSYYGASVAGAQICYVVQDEPLGLCDALFRPLPFIAEGERVCFGLPDTIWFPEDGFLSVGGDPLAFLLFPVERPEFFDAVEFDSAGRVSCIEVKAQAPRSRWVWGAFGASSTLLRELQKLWLARERRDEYIGTLVNAYLSRGGEARAVCAGQKYVDVGTVNGYRDATHLVETYRPPKLEAAPRPPTGGKPKRTHEPVLSKARSERQDDGRSGDDLERTEQPVSLGLRARP